MVNLTFGLIRQNNPGLNFDDVDEIVSIRLENLQIETIDNLELFSEVLELHLSRNKIQIIDNMLHLKKLLFLDLSFNKIDSSGLRKSLKSIPLSVETLILTGNECANDDDVLTELNELFPHMGIVIDSIEETDGENEGEKSENEEDYDDSLADPLIPTGQPLNADAVLKAIVERKCRLQTVQSSFSLEASKQVLLPVLCITSIAF